MEDKKYICKYCSKEFETSVKLGGHVSRCSMNPNSKQVYKKVGQKNAEHAQINIYDIQCPVCGKYKQIRMSLNTYIKSKYTKTCSNECAHKLTIQNTDIEKRNKNISNGVKKYVQTHITTTYKKCRYCGKIFIKQERGKSDYCSVECMKSARFEKLSHAAKKREFGGYHENSIKKYHHGNYKGIHYDSSWELAYIIYCLDHNIDIKRCDIVRYYEINGVRKRYFPDFIVNNEIIEIKGFYNNVSKIKAEQNPDIKILLENDMKIYIDYAISIYGKEFWNFNTTTV